MKYLLEVLKIVDGAANADRSKVVVYAEQLASKLENDGDQQAAARLRRAYTNGKIRSLDSARGAPNGRIPVDSDSRLPLADEDSITSDMDIEVFVDYDVQETINEFLNYVHSADRLISHGVGISPSLILFGPPGCGKTELGRQIAKRLALPLLTARIDSLISSFLGNTAKNLRVLFEHAMARPCVLFLDEFDAIAKLRDDQYELGELKRVVVSLLQNIDALDRHTILLAATNHEHLLDQAIWRRFAYQVRIDLPDAHNRNQLFRRFLGSFTNPNNLKTLARISEGLSGAQIRQISEDAKRQAILADKSSSDLSSMLLRIVKQRNPNLSSRDADLKTKIKSVRQIDEKVFTYRRLASLFDISLGKVSALINSED